MTFLSNIWSWFQYRLSDKQQTKSMEERDWERRVSEPLTQDLFSSFSLLATVDRSRSTSGELRNSGLGANKQITDLDMGGCCCCTATPWNLLKCESYFKYFPRLHMPKMCHQSIKLWKRNIQYKAVSSWHPWRRRVYLRISKFLTRWEKEREAIKSQADTDRQTDRLGKQEESQTNWTRMTDQE